MVILVAPPCQADFYSREGPRRSRALRAMVDNPQNFFQIFVDSGKLRGGLHRLSLSVLLHDFRWPLSLLGEPRQLYHPPCPSFTQSLSIPPRSQYQCRR
jgi:hypothetical protein